MVTERHLPFLDEKPAKMAAKRPFVFLSLTWEIPIPDLKVAVKLPKNSEKNIAILHVLWGTSDVFRAKFDLDKSKVKVTVTQNV